MSTATAAASIDNDTVIPHRNVVPSEVGWQFVPQYYTFMNKQPERLHCFYTKQSTFTHGAEGDDVTPCHGQAEIHAKITSLNLHDCKVFIHSVDAQASLNGGIVIQVIGEMSNKDEAWRKFVQTFFLAEQPNGYFVLNDVFRYLKEESVEDESLDAPQQDEPVTVDQPVVSIPTTDETTVDLQAHPAAVDPVFGNDTQPIPSEGFTPASKSPAPEPAPELAADSPPAAVSGDWIDQEPSPAPPTPAENGVAPQKPATPPPAPAAQAPEPTPSPAAPAPAANGSAQPSKPAAPQAKAAPEKSAAPAPAAAAPAPQAPPAKPVPKTWANLAAANSNKWGATAASTQATSTAAPPAPAQTPPAGAKPAAQRPASGQAQQNRSPGYQAAMTITTPAVFIKGVVDPLTNDLLKSFLTTKFGALKEIEVVRSKACAFVEFSEINAARRAIVASLPIPQGGEGGVFYRYEDDTPPTRISIETRKERGDRPVSSGASRGTGRGGFESGRGGSNADSRGSFRGRGRGRGTSK